jgi:hypothetical protein
MIVGTGESELDVRRWAHLVSLLSMDVVRPFFDLMGLKLSSPAQLQDVLRREVIAGRKSGVVVPSARLPVIPQRVLQAVRESLGEGASSHLVWWERHVYHRTPSKDHRGLRKWISVLQRSQQEPGSWGRLGLPPGARDRFERSRNLDEYVRRQKEVEPAPLSDWDLHLYALHLYDDNLYGTNDLRRVPDGPRLYVTPTIRAYQGYQFWTWLLSTLRLEQLDRLWQEGQRIVEEKELHSARGLPHPSLLDIGL